jgi:hypothetical protein
MTRLNENGHGVFAGAEVISSYSRAEAIADGVLIDVTETAKEAGFKYPVAVTQGVFGQVVEPPDLAVELGESVEGRLWDVLFMCASAARQEPATRLTVAPGTSIHRELPVDTVYFEVLATDQYGVKKTHKVWAKCGPGDTAAPVVTVMLEGED